MMTRARFRQTARLERLAEAYLRPREETDSRFEEFVRNCAFIHTANLSALILYGDPKIEEPLSFAWRRCLESAEWQKRRKNTVVGTNMDAMIVGIRLLVLVQRELRNTSASISFPTFPVLMKWRNLV